MTFPKHINKQNLGLFGTIVSGLILGIPAISLPASAQTQPNDRFMSIAYCPGVYISFEEAYNETDLRRCPLSAEEIRLREQQLSAQESDIINFENRTNDIQPSLLEDTPNPIDRTTTGNFEYLPRNQNNGQSLQR